MPTIQSLAPLTTAEIHISENADWRDTIPQLLQGGLPRDCTGYDLELFIRPSFDHSLLIKRLATNEAEHFGSDTVLNGGFADATNWTLTSGWSVGSGVATKTSGNTNDIKQNNILSNGSTYELTYTILNYSAGTLTPQLRATNEVTTSGVVRSANGTYTERLLVYRGASGAGVLSFVPNSAFAGSIDNVSLKEVQGPEIFWMDEELGQAQIIVRRDAENGVRAVLAVNPPGVWDWFLNLFGPISANPLDGLFYEEVLRGRMWVHPGEITG